MPQVQPIVMSPFVWEANHNEYYTTGDANVQLNLNNQTYNYIAIG